MYAAKNLINIPTDSDIDENEGNADDEYDSSSIKDEPNEPNKTICRSNFSKCFKCHHDLANPMYRYCRSCFLVICFSNF